MREHDLACELLAGYPEARCTCRNRGDADTGTMQDDLQLILLELGLGDHARQASPHQVVIGEVLPRIRELATAEPDRGEPVDLSDLREGDHVEVTYVGWVDREGWIRSHETDENLLAPPRDAATVRMVRRAEPEPDPEQVQALAAHLQVLSFDADGGNTWLAAELVRRGVRPPETGGGDA